MPHNTSMSLAIALCHLCGLAAMQAIFVASGQRPRARGPKRQFDHQRMAAHFAQH
jgi:hypothetical protein